MISVCLYRIADQLETNQYIPQAEEDSPYPEVRAAVANIDDPDMPANTFRVWVIGACLISMTVHCNTSHLIAYQVLSSPL